MEPVQPLQTNIYQSNTYRKDVNDEPRVQERQQMKDQQSKALVFVPCQSTNTKHQPRRDTSIPFSDMFIMMMSRKLFVNFLFLQKYAFKVLR